MDCIELMHKKLDLANQVSKVFICLTGTLEPAWHFTKYILQMIGDMVTGTVSPKVVRILSCTLLPVVLADSLLDNTSYLVSRLAAVNEDVDIPQGDATLEIKSLL